eukprot:tig00021796_g23561.t1
MQLVLVGAGHANLQVVRDLELPTPTVQRGRRAPGIPPPILISDERWAWYSGMVPGVVAGIYKPEEARVDAEALCKRHGWLFLRATAAAVLPDLKVVELSDGRHVPYDVLSVNVGSAVRGSDVPGFEHAIPARPAGRLVAALDAFEGRWVRDPSSSVPSIVVVGAGAAGAELAFAVRARLERLAWGWLPEVTLVDEARGLPALGAAARLVRRRVNLFGIRLLEGYRATGVGPSGVELRCLESEEAIALRADAVIWATGPAPPPLVANSANSLERDPAGFIAVGATLESLSAAGVFAAGDCAGIVEEEGGPAPKAGVSAVRAGPVLVRNIARLLAEPPGAPPPPLPARLKPRAPFLRIISTADGSAIATKCGVAVEGRGRGVEGPHRPGVDGRLRGPRAPLAAPPATPSTTPPGPEPLPPALRGRDRDR